MRKLLSLLLVLTVPILCFFSASAESQGPETHVCGEYEYIILEDGTAEIARYTGEAVELVIPAELDGLTVSSIGKGAFFFGRSSPSPLMAVTIPDSVTAIGDFRLDSGQCFRYRERRVFHVRIFNIRHDSGRGDRDRRRHVQLLFLPDLCHHSGQRGFHREPRIPGLHVSCVHHDSGQGDRDR